MCRRRVAWVVSLVLMAGGGLVAHALAYRIAPSGGHAEAHGSAGHGYLAQWPICVAVCATLAAAWLAVSAGTRLRASRPVVAPLWIFAVLPPVGFVVQEHLERLFATGVFPHAAALEPTFAIGLILQLPFAVVAYLVARALIAFVVAVATRYRRRPDLRARSSSVARRRPVWIAGAPLAALALGTGERAPPSPAL